ncbi:hypothetical protein ACH4GP_18240 [Streptomyces celluloflavus]|uniref:Uncharacterized protein n=1 Tax=Streptomyces celluloflavus TaxID=58344 RepID=A0ABW7RG10_9ACTN
MRAGEALTALLKENENSRNELGAKIDAVTETLRDAVQQVRGEIGDSRVNRLSELLFKLRDEVDAAHERVDGMADTVSVLRLELQGLQESVGALRQAADARGGATAAGPGHAEPAPAPPDTPSSDTDPPATAQPDTAAGIHPCEPDTATDTASPPRTEAAPPPCPPAAPVPCTDAPSRPGQGSSLAGTTATPAPEDTVPPTPDPHHVPAEYAAPTAPTTPDAAEQAHHKHLLAAARVASVLLTCHRDTWEFVIGQTGDQPHFRLPPQVTDAGDGRIQAALSGRSLIAVLLTLWKTRGRNTFDADWALAHTLYTRVTDNLTALTPDGGQVAITLDDRTPITVGRPVEDPCADVARPADEPAAQGPTAHDDTNGRQEHA